MTVTNTGPTTLAGNLGVNPGSAITGFPPGLVASATHEGDAQAVQARSDLTTAYDDAAGSPGSSDTTYIIGHSVKTIATENKDTLKDSPIWTRVPNRLILVGCCTADLGGTNIIITADLKPVP